MVRYTRKGLLKGEGNMGFLTGKTAIITGAGRAVLSDGRCGSIGYGIATAYAKEGANLVITGRNVQKLTDAKEELERLYGIKVLPVQADVSAGADNKAVVDNVVKQAIDTFGRIDVLINNAQASASGVTLADHTQEQFDLAMYSGLYAVFYYMQACYPYLKETKGSVINFASGAGLFGNYGQCAYAAAKEGIRGLTRVAATEWGPDGINVNIVCPGFIRLNGMTVGAVANRSKVYDENAEVVEEFDGALSARGARKAARFVEFCDAFNIPVLTLTNVSGFAATMCAERSLAKAAAKLTYAFANATVPKVNVVIGKAFGSAYVTMNSKSLGADMVYAWPTAEIGMMEADLAAKIMYADADAETINEKAKEYAELQSSPVSAARRGYVDTIIQPADTRKYVIGAFEMLFTKREESPMKKHGTV